MPLNDPGAPLSGARSPRFKVLLNNKEIGGCFSIETDSNNNYSPDSFKCQFVCDKPGMPLLSFWGETDTILVEIKLDDGTAAGAGYKSVFVGEVDSVDADPVQSLVAVNGRDLSRRLVDAKTQESFLNQTSSQVAVTLAGRHKLIPVVTATTTPIARYYGADHDHITDDQFSRTTTEWDLLVYLAQHEGYDVFVQGYELHFQPQTALTDPPYVVRFDRSGAATIANCMNPHMSRSLTMAKDIEVWVRSWSPGSKSGFTKKSGGKSGGGAGSGKAQRVVIVRPNLTEDRAQKLANSIREDLTRHERLFNFDLPGETMLTARNLVSVEGTGTSWDQVYYIDNISRRMSVSEGFVQSIRCKNHSPENESLPL